MPTVKLVASNYSVSGTVTVSNANNMYTDVSSTTYATITHTTTGTTSYYCYIKGFNFSSIPSDVIVSSFTIRIRGYESGLSTSTSYAPRLYNNTSSITGASAASSNFGANASTITVPFTGTWDTLKGYGANLGIRVVIRRSSRNTQGYLYVYGAEIEVTYTVPVYHTITATGDGVLDPAGQTSLLEGEDYTLRISGITPSVTDNGVDVTNQLITTTEVTSTLIPESNTNSGWYGVTNIGNAYHDADNSSYADFELAGGATGTVYLDIGDILIPSSATIISVSAKATLQYNRNNSSSGFTCSCQMYANTTAKGSSTTVVSAGGTDVAKTTFNLSVGSWTASEINNARFYLTATNNASSTRRHMYVYGVSFIVTYESSGITYVYTLTNVTADHTIVVTASVSSNKILFKNNGSWVEAIKVYKKVNGSWVEQSDLTTVFDSNTNYVKG